MIIADEYKVIIFLLAAGAVLFDGYCLYHGLTGKVRILGASPEALKIPATDSVALPNEASFEVLDLKRIKNPEDTKSVLLLGVIMITAGTLGPMVGGFILRRFF